MLRCFFLVLPLCLILQDQPTSSEESSGTEDSAAIQVIHKQVAFQGTDLLRQELLGGLAFATPQAFPASIPWGSMHDIGSKGLYPLDFLLHYHPVLFLEMCLERYKREVTGYSSKFLKRERIGGKLEALEKYAVLFRENPFSVSMHWLEGGEGIMKPLKVLYVDGENNGNLLARGRGYLYHVGVLEKAVDSPDAKRNGRYTIDHFGIFLGTQRTVATMGKAQARGALYVAYHGICEVPQLGGRECYKFVRTPYDPPEDDGINELTIFIDKENWLQVGSVLKDVHGNLIADYFFRDLKINPEFKKEQFTRAAL